MTEDERAGLRAGGWVTTRLGVVTDVHADLGGLQLALAQMDALGVDLVVCCGDVVDGGDQPEATIALLRERGIPTIRGNHDRWAVARHDNGEPAHDGDAGRLHLRDETVEWLRDLPTGWSATIESVRVVMCHGTPPSDMDGLWPDESDVKLLSWLAVVEAEVLIAGHTHIPLERRVGLGKLVVNPGALWRGAEAFAAAMLLDPAGGPARERAQHAGGRFGVLELPSKRWTVRRV